VSLFARRASSPELGAPVLPPANPGAQYAQAERAPLAPGPLTDKYPIIIGAGSTLAYLSSVNRLCITGYRREFVDFLRELLERDGATKALLASRFATVAGGRLEITPADLPEGHPETQAAEEIADECRIAVDGIPDRTQAIFNLLWAAFWGVAAAEIGWKRRPDGFIAPDRLYTIANRRIAYPSYDTWDAHIWDQGNVTGAGTGFQQPTNSPIFGLNLSKVANKFIVHTPSYSGDYPTREGMGRELGPLMIFKILGMRCGAQFVERFTKIVFFASMRTQDATQGNPGGNPRAANEDDYEVVSAAMFQLGLGGLASMVVPDCATVHMEGPGTKGDAGTKIIRDWVELVDAQIQIIIRGSSLTTTPGKFGSKGSGDTGQLAEAQNERFDAITIAETLRRDLVGAIVRVNRPTQVHLIPKVTVHLDDPTPAAIVKLYAEAAATGAEVDADAMTEEAGLRTIPNTTGKPRRLAPIKPIELSAEVLGGETAALAERQAAEAAKAEAAATQAKADAAAQAAQERPDAQGPANDTRAPGKGRGDTQEPRPIAAE
jgi:hypothetical protein